MLKKLTLCVAFSLALSSTSLYAKTAELSKSVSRVFQSGDKENTGYHTFRIPTIVKTKKNSLLAFAEGRVNGWGDAGNIDIVMRRSKDGGKTWEPMQVVFDDGGNTCRNPCPVIDTKTGRIFLITTWSNKHEGTIMDGKGRCSIYVLTSDDDGSTWSKPVEITDQVNRPDWWWYATGPASAIQIQKGKYRGRIVVAANHSIITAENKKIHRSHTFYSDDLG
ncbi:MAG: sialidase family protein, partial [Lentisphaeria bacterium]